MRTHTALLALGLSMLAAAPAAAQGETPPAPGTPRPFSVPDAREFSLPNGLDVTLVPYGAIPKATISLVVRAGNVDEAPDEVWLADLTADLMEEGSTTRDAARLATETADMGGSLSVGVGANTTSIGGSVLGEFTPRMVELVADVARNPALPASALDRLRADRLRQLSIARSQPQQLAHEEFRAALYPGHAYGRLFPAPEMLQGYSLEQARGFHARNFHAGRAHLYVAGRFDADAVEAAIREAFGDWRGGPESSPSTPAPSIRRAIHLVDLPGSVQSSIYMGLPVVDPSHPDYVALQVTNALLGGSFGSRITSNIREDKGYTYSPYSTLSARYRDAYWAEIADVTTNVTGASIREILGEIERLRAEPPPAEELRGIQNYLAGTFVLQNSTRSGIINQLVQVDLHGLGEDHLESYVQRVYAVTPQDVQRIARTYLDPERLTIVVVGDRSQVAEQLEPFGEVE